MATVTKQGVKNYLNITNKDLMEKLKNNIENESNWNNFKSEFTTLIEKYVENPTNQNQNQIYQLISMNYISNNFVAKDILKDILKGLNVNLKENNQQSKDENYLRALYSSFGLNYDLDKEMREDYENMKNISTINNKQTLSFHKNMVTKVAYKNYGQSVVALNKNFKEKGKSKSKDKEQASVKRLVKKIEMIDDADKKLDVVIEDLKNAKQTISGKNNSQKEKMDDDVKLAYEDMLNNPEDKEKVVEFEKEISKKENSQKESMKRDISSLISDKKLYEQFENIFENNFPNLSRNEFMEQVDYVFNNSKVDKEGRLIIPKDSIFRNVILDENGEIRSDKEDVVDILFTNYEFKKVTDLSDKDIVDISKDFKDNRDENKLDIESKGYAFRSFLESHPELVSSTFDILVDNLTDTYDKYMVTQDLKQEAEINHKLILSDDIKEQFGKIKNIVRQYNDKEQSDGDLDKKDNKKRELALKIAREKVKALEKAKLSKVVKNGNRSSQDVLDRAKGILLPHLENARNRDVKKIERDF